MQKFIKKLKCIYLNRIIALIILELFFISTVPVYPQDTNNNKKDTKQVLKNVAKNIKDKFNRNNKVTLNISYSFDVDDDVLYISWNRNINSGKKYYVFKKLANEDRYELDSSKEGIEYNYYLTSLKDNVGAKFVVCEDHPELPKIPEGVTINADYDMGQYVGLFKELKGSEYTESNIIEIKLDRKYADYDEKKKYVMLDTKDEKKDEKKVEEKKVIEKKEEKEEKKPVDEKLVEKLEKVKEEVKRVCNSAIKGPVAPPGFYWLDDNSDIEYKGIRLNNLDNSAPPKSFIYINTLEDDEKVDNKPDSTNATYGEGKDKIKGYDVTLFTLREKEKEVEEKKSDNNIENDLRNSDADVFSYYSSSNNKQLKTEKKAEVEDNDKFEDKKTEIESYIEEYLMYKIGHENGEKYYWEVSNKFINQIDVSIKIDTDNIPNYINKENCFVYYYDLNALEWISLPRESFDTKSYWTKSKTDHLCQFYGGTMEIQNEPPQAKGINTNPINIQAVDPLAGITSIAPPTPNNRGTANVSYPISVPEGINGLTPQVSINYDSDGKEGDCGYGWNISTSKITVDTKKGFPKFNSTDVLSLDDNELVNLGNNQYRYKEANKSCAKIIRNGDSFVVYNTDGSKSYYGQTGSSKISNYIWYLTKIEDKFNNEINYEYIKTNYSIYLTKIRYGYNDKYSIEFGWQYRVDRRKQIVTSYYGAIAGRKFIIIKDKILTNIKIKYGDKELKRYELQFYNQSQLKLSMLKKIIEKSNNEILNENEFLYGGIGTGSVKIEEEELSFGPETNFKVPEGGTVDRGNEKLVSFKEQNFSSMYHVPYIDINGDGFLDILTAAAYGEVSLYVRFNTGSGYAANEVRWVWRMDLPVVPNNLNNNGGDSNNNEEFKYYIAKFGFDNINGDNLPDIVYKNIPNKQFVRLNTGNGFGNKLLWDVNIIPDEGKITDNNEKYVKLNGSNLDMNGDGLSDMVRAGTYDDDVSIYVRLNTGYGYAYEEVIWARRIPLPVRPNNHADTSKPLLYYEPLFSLSDVNHDKMADIVAGTSEDNSYIKYVKLNTGTGFAGKTLWDSKNAGYNNYKMLTKVINKKTNSTIDLWYKKKKAKNLIKTAVFDETGTSTADKQKKIVLSAFTIGNNLYKQTTNIDYANGYYSVKQGEFRGIKNVTVTTRDEAKGVNHITKYLYRIEDEYYKDQPMVITQTINNIIKSKEYYIYDKIDVLNSGKKVKYVYPKESRVWLYNDEGEFIGVDETNGDIASKTIFEDDDIDKINGLIKKSTSINYGDPHHDNDDTKTITKNIIDKDEWLCLPNTNETIELKDEEIISFKTIEYNDNGSVKKEKVWNNEGADPITEYGYDQYGNVNKVSSYTNENNSALITKTDTTYILSDNYYKQVKTTTPDGLSTTTKFDIYQRGVETTDIYGDTSTIIFDNYGRVISIKEIVNNTPVITKTFTYSKEEDYFKVEASYLDNAGGDNYIKMQFYKDGLGRNVQTKKESMVNGSKCWIVSGYLVRDKMGRAIEQGVPTTADYDETGYVNNKDESLEIKTTFEYDTFGRFSKACMPNGYEVTKEYDTKVESYDNSITGEKGLNRIVSVSILRDNEERESKEYKDLMDNVVRTEVMNKSLTKSIETIFEYNLRGYGKVTESTGAVGEKQFNTIGGLMWMKTPDAGKFEYKYNDKLLVSTVKDYGKNMVDGVTRVINYQYDQYNRMTDIKYSGFGDNDIKYEYFDNTGEGNRYARSCIKSISKGDYYKAEYDFGQLWIDVKKTIEGTSYLTKYTYDVQGRIDYVKYSDGEIINYDYDEGGYLKSITGTQNYISNIKYNEYGQRTSFKYGNGVETTYEYTKETGLLNIMTQTKGANELLKYDYDFDLTGNLTKLSDSPKGAQRSIQEYSYDKMGRIQSAKGSYKGGSKSYNETYTFDNDNRILEKTFSSGMKYSFNYENTDHAIRSIDITGSPNGETRVDFNYDDFGNMTKKTLTKNSSTSITEFKYDETNKLIEIDLPDSCKRLEFKYDNGGQRIVKEFRDKGGVITKNVYVNGFYEITNGAINKHISDGKYIFASKLDNNDDNLIYYSQNNIGSTTLLTDKNGSDIGQFLYTPFGEMWVEEASTVDISNITRFFTNQQYDKESGLYYYNARYYDPHLGSFITPDPKMANLNHYAYCSANPIKYTDPTGLDEDEEDETTTETTEDDDEEEDDDYSDVIVDENGNPVFNFTSSSSGGGKNNGGKPNEPINNNDNNNNSDNKQNVNKTNDNKYPDLINAQNIYNKYKDKPKNKGKNKDIDVASIGEKVAGSIGFLPFVNAIVGAILNVITDTKPLGGFSLQQAYDKVYNEYVEMVVEYYEVYQNCVDMLKSQSDFFNLTKSEMNTHKDNLDSKFDQYFKQIENSFAPKPLNKYDPYWLDR